MSIMRVPLRDHGISGREALAVIESDDDGFGLFLVLTAESPEDGSETRHLHPDEARAIAAALNHYAAEAER